MVRQANMVQHWQVLHWKDVVSSDKLRLMLGNDNGAL